MIYSDEKEFIFTKSNKTAGTSVEIELSRAIAVTASSIVSPTSSEDELIRLRLGGCSPQNCYLDLAGSIIRRPRRVLAAVYHAIRGLPGFLSGMEGFLKGRQSAEQFIEQAFEYRNALMRPLLKYRNHIHTSAVRVLLGDPLFFGCYRFGFTHDPMQSALSHYTWNQFEQHDFAHRSIEEHRQSLCEHIKARFSPSRKFFFDPATQEAVVSDVFRYEDLEASLMTVCQYLDWIQIWFFLCQEPRFNMDSRFSPSPVTS